MLQSNIPERILHNTKSIVSVSKTESGNEIIYKELADEEEVELEFNIMSALYKSVGELNIMPEPFDILVDDDQCRFSMQYLNGTSPNVSAMTLRQVKDMCCKVWNSLIELHHAGLLMHGDLVLRNVIQVDDRFYIIDFGESSLGYMENYYSNYHPYKSMHNIVFDFMCLTYSCLNKVGISGDVIAYLKEVFDTTSQSYSRLIYGPGSGNRFRDTFLQGAEPSPNKFASIPRSFLDGELDIKHELDTNDLNDALNGLTSILHK